MSQTRRRRTDRAHFLPTAAIALALSATAPQAADLTLQLGWLPGLPSAGYFVAQDQGFYRDEGLNLTILPGGPGIAPARTMAEGRADLVQQMLPAALAARDNGLPLVNIAQSPMRSELGLSCLRQGIASPGDLAGKTLAIWYDGQEYPILTWLTGLQLSSDRVTLLPRDTRSDPLAERQANCIATLDPAERGALPPGDLVHFRAPDAIAQPGNGLYVLDSMAQDALREADLAAFLRASARGWAYARDNPEQAAAILQAHGATGSEPALARQIARQAAPEGRLDPADYQRHVQQMRDAGLIRAEPSGLIAQAGAQP